MKINLKMLPIALLIPRHHQFKYITNTATAHGMAQHQSLYFSLVRMIIDLTSSLHEKQMLILLCCRCPRQHLIPDAMATYIIHIDHVLYEIYQTDVMEMSSLFFLFLSYTFLS